jgi:hypothetical protein
MLVHLRVTQGHRFCMAEREYRQLLSEKMWNEN